VLAQALREKGLTQEQIGERIGWSRDLVARHYILINKIVPKILNIAKKHQTGRVTLDVTNVTFNFTEGWFSTVKKQPRMS